MATKSKSRVFTVADAKSIVGSLAHSQGFYGRLWEQLEESRAWGKMVRAARKAGVKDEMDFILWIEG